ncbi:hypothetical protein PVAND_013247 [Polypedilum vanderplanki]|uniref:BED-type domain-containing protein n=2 Tax=Polypedilum vanderplanki TaxID=319348 RepID=A0A9J6CNY3_POLVA|nr:hypothetical protein PVAND_013247 [Polypedilum vanderplanki]
MSSVWSYADKIKDGIKLSGQCHQCKKIIICSNRSTTTLKNHLKTHGIFITADIEQKKDKNNHEVQSSRQKFKTMDKFLVKQTLNEIISDLATDGASIRFITRNSFIRRAIKKEGFNLPVNERDVMKLLIEDFEQKKVNLCEKFKQMVHDGRKLSISVDEFTSIRGRRYFGLNIHDSFNNATYNTGLVRILGSCPAEDMLIIIKNHLNDFGISLDKDIVGSTQDGAAINKKFIRISNIIGQFCFNHAIHLAVCDSLYTNKQNNDEYTVEDSNDIDDEDTFEMATDFEIIETSIDNIDHHHLLKISRKIVKFIKISPIRNQIFQSKVKSIYGKEIELHLDVKHRWNSIPTMISPLIKTKAALFETFAELNSLPIINKLDFEALKILEKAMDPIRVTVLALSRQDATLLTADKAL